MAKPKEKVVEMPAPVAKRVSDNPKNEWTLKKGIVPGARYALSRHLVECVELVRAELTYDVWRVHVLGPITMRADGSEINEVVPPLMFAGELYDTGGAFANQRAPEGYR